MQGPAVSEEAGASDRWGLAGSGVLGSCFNMLDIVGNC